MMSKMKSCAVLLGLFFTTSACSHIEAPPPTVSDFCLNDRAVTVDVVQDTEPTILDVLSHNATYHRLCPNNNDTNKES